MMEFSERKFECSFMTPVTFAHRSNNHRAPRPTPSPHSKRKQLTKEVEAAQGQEDTGGVCGLGRSPRRR